MLGQALTRVVEHRITGPTRPDHGGESDGNEMLTCFAQALRRTRGDAL
jgi:hypothetical protein